MKFLRLNVKKLLLAMANCLLSLATLFWLRRLILCLMGAKVGTGVTIHRSVRLFEFGSLEIGANTTINPWCFLDNRGGLKIGNNVNISHSVRIYSMGHDVDDPACAVFSHPVVIEDDAWIFPSCLVMPGVTVGKGAVLYPGSVVVRDVPAYAVVGGNPARVIRERKRDQRYCAAFPVWFGV
ncbi:acyltransferase [Stenotrophomonas maltophilia]|nr:acyltransferase [Stenotrophomonas maltophilia]MBA0468476.1 acyltransferase [Stenotrophomonas maltophilia]MBA0475479.1 acyltransferase [Stenotrophomonas maltophilia]MBA0484797.1 acyltransferase [Stenotrophomonas maltophilia]